ncbi:hypothetical protein L1987_74422 [Smallanthus sonchifolius]|uniref:Uncharacterized protein n=1 Tax=Smallanthus sonchifolius TaxID=185202 RepID=A0ACB9A254_9ASTR|nr:hypothetical protein L1987_74422 [Smallanthus sonchifolius]
MPGQGDPPMPQPLQAGGLGYEANKGTGGPRGGRPTSATAVAANLAARVLLVRRQRCWWSLVKTVTVTRVSNPVFRRDAFFWSESKLGFPRVRIPVMRWN